ncbi:flavin reductase [Paenibacillus swuensis]|uniref:Flavin reductase n=1 Tax=Paenibacillus swuensis TaxID=1178515 RepID=A0A172TKY7_9BACL|nr:flavin reductase family protein [Paenibacillus swuensis]ANE47715.1 flavin reductase [Paenibacillus swuensis]
MKHVEIQPNILYFGTPVVLISTMNEDGSANLAPMSSAWWLNQSCMLGLSRKSQTVENLQRNKECVLNLPSVELVRAVDRLALYTGKNPVPESKAKRGYTYLGDKFETAGVSEQPSHLVGPPRVMECPVQLEATMVQIHDFEQPSSLVSIEVKILKVHIDEELLLYKDQHYIDPDKWKPLIMNFCEFYGLNGRVHSSRLAPLFTPLVKHN